MDVPFLGEWQRGEEHEGKLTVSCRDYHITIKRPWCDKTAEHWMVETFQVWPHPNAPLAPVDTDCPEWRAKCYKELIEKDEVLPIKREKPFNIEFWVKEELGGTVGHMAGLERMVINK